MKIIVDMQPVQTASRHRGIGRYTLSLIDALLNLPHQHEIYLVFSTFFPETVEPLKQHFSHFLPLTYMFTWRAFNNVAAGNVENHRRAQASACLREFVLASFQPDIIYVPSLFEGFYDDAVTSVKFFHDIPTVVTLFDLIPLVCREHFLDSNPVMKNWYEKKLEDLKQADLLLAISDASRMDAISHLQFREEGTVNISSAISNFWQEIDVSLEKEHRVKKRYHITRSFLMSVASVEPHKNVKNLILAYLQLPEKLRAKYQLMIIGNKVDTLQKEYRDLLRNQDEIIFTDYVPDEDLRVLYNLCTLFILPSLYEGFGLPALEAMACGAPVIGSNTSSIPEVISFKEALFDPHDINSMSAKIKQVLEDGNFRQILKHHAEKQKEKFSWEISAKNTLHALESLHERQKNNVGSPSFSQKKMRQAVQKEMLKILEGTPEASKVPALVVENFPLGTQKQILYDISELVKHDAKSGIQRVVWGYMQEWLKEPPPGFVFEPIYSSEHDGIYYYARQFIHRFLYQRDSEQPDELVEPREGDIFLSFDLIATGLDVREATYRAWKTKGVSFYFMLYDLIAVQHPEYFCEHMTSIMNAWIRQMTSLMDGVICISQAAANSLLQWLDAGEIFRKKTLRIAWQHLGSDFKSHQNEIIKCPVLPEKSFKIITVGTIEIRKGYDQALAAFEQLWEANIPVSWIIVGKPGWKVDELIQKLRYHVQKNINLFWFDDATDELLISLYKESDGCFVPSYAEGFGLPLIEAAHYGLPILARDLLVFREIAGEAISYFSGDAHVLALAIKAWHQKVEKKEKIKTKMSTLTWADCAKGIENIILSDNWPLNWVSDGIRLDRHYIFSRALPYFVELSGLSHVESWGRWTDSNKVNIVLVAKKTCLEEHPKGFVHFKIQPFLMPPLIKKQRVEISWGVEHSTVFSLKQRRWISLPYSLEDWESGADEDCRRLCIQWNIPGAAVPINLDDTTQDRRLLGIGFLEFFVSEKNSIHSLVSFIKKKQIFYDISELVKDKLKTGIQRVTLEYMRELLKSDSPDYIVEPVFISGDNQYHYARTFLPQLMIDDLKEDISCVEDPIIANEGDIFICAELTTQNVSAKELIFQEWKEQGVKLFFMIFDLLPITHSEYFVDGQKLGVLSWLECIVKVANGFITISKNVADNLYQWLKKTQPFRHERLSISWVHIGANFKGKESLSAKTPSNFQKTLLKLQACPSFLMVGTIEPRKGHAQVLQAFEHLWAKGINVNLVIVGKIGWLVDDLVNKLRQHSLLGKNLFLFEKASDEVLLACYKTVSCYLMASYVEGFGLPLVEAAQHELPILARDIPVFHEVAGKHATYFSGNERKLADAIAKWIKQFAKNKVVLSKNLPYLTWGQSADQLLNTIMHQKNYLQWYPKLGSVKPNCIYSLSTRQSFIDMQGFASPESWGVWSSEKSVKIVVYAQRALLKKVPSGYIHLEIAPFLFEKLINKQSVKICIGGKLKSFVFEQSQWISLNYDSTDWEEVAPKRSIRLILDFFLPDAKSPKQLDDRINDTRTLGLGFTRLSVSVDTSINFNRNNKFVKFFKVLRRISTTHFTVSQLADQIHSLQSQILEFRTQMFELNQQQAKNLSVLQESLNENQQQSQQALQALQRHTEQQQQQHAETLLTLQGQFHESQQQLKQLTHSEVPIDLDDFYEKLSDKFRGTEEDIQHRLEIYLPYFNNLSDSLSHLPIVDIGCGRGELLQVLTRAGKKAIGVDANAKVIERCKAKSLEVVQSDFIEYLSQQSSNALAAVTGIHIVEHLPFPVLLHLLKETYRTLASNGIAIFETPNPENIQTATVGFYLDPSHYHPIPPSLLVLAAEFSGFSRVELLRLHPVRMPDLNAITDKQEIKDILYRFDMEQDYAVIAYKT